MKKPRFVGCYDVRFLDDGRMAQMRSTLTFIDSAGCDHYAPKNFIFDGGSIPRFFWRTIGPPFTGRARKAYPIHDWECARARDREAFPDRWATRAAADRTLREMCLALHVRRWKAAAVYVGVRIGAAKEAALRGLRPIVATA